MAAAEADVAYSIRTAPCSALSASGELVECEMKLFLYETGDVYFELRRFMLAFYQENDQLQLHKKIKISRPAVALLLEDWGLQYDAEVTPSFRAAARLSEEDVLNPKVRSEYTTSTAATLAFLLHLYCDSHKVTRQNRAAALLRGLLLKLTSLLSRSECDNSFTK